MPIKPVYVWTAMVLIAALRFVSLDADPPAYNLSGINVTDEPYYCITGLNQYLSEEERLIEEVQITENSILFKHNELPTYLGVKLFGYTYHGLRTPVVLVSLLVILLLWTLVRRNGQLNRAESLVFLGICGLEYSFFVYSRYQNPQIYSILWIALTLWIVASVKRHDILFLTAAFALSIAVTIVYPYTAFAALGFGALVVMEVWETKRVRPLIYAALGVGGGVVLLSLLLFMDGQSLLDYIELFSSVNEVREERTEISIKGLTLNLLQIPLTNLFRFNPLLFVLALGTMVLMIPNFFKSSRVLKLCFLMVIAAFLQSMFNNSYPFKKWVVLFPVFLLLAVQIGPLLRETTSKRWRILAFVLSSLGTLLMLYSIRVNNQPEYWAGFANDYLIVPMGWTGQGVLISGLLLGWLLLSLSLLRLEWVRRQLIWIYVIMLLPSTFLTLSYVKGADSEYRSALESFGPDINESLIIGDFSHAFGFYNQGKVGYNPYTVSYGFQDSSTIENAIDNHMTLILIRKDLNGTSNDYRDTLFHKYFDKKSDGILDLYLFSEEQ